MSEPEQSIERSFGWSNMWVVPEEDPRADGTWDGHDERAVITGYLADYRLTLRMKCAGLDAEQLARRSVPPSNLSLLGLVRHLANVERYWLRIRMVGQDLPECYPPGGGNDPFDAAVPDPAVVEEGWQRWQEEVGFSDNFVRDAADLDIEGPRGDVLRNVLIHLIEEYARHLGHADFLRERIDGRVGQ